MLMHLMYLMYLMYLRLHFAHFVCTRFYSSAVKTDGKLSALVVLVCSDLTLGGGIL